MTVSTLRNALSCINNTITQSLYTEQSNYKFYNVGMTTYSTNI